MRDGAEVKHLAGVKPMGCTINTIDHGVPAESEVGAEGSAYALETLRIKKNAYFGKTALIL